MEKEPTIGYDRQVQISGVTPANITSAAIIAQFGILAIAAVGWLIIRRDHRFASLFRDRPHYIQLGVILLLFAFVSLGLLFVSDAFSNSWLPLFGPTSLRPHVSPAQPGLHRRDSLNRQAMGRKEAASRRQR